MGQWGPGAYANQSGIGTPEDPIADRLPAEFGWFPFPAVEGGAGLATDGFGGGDGFAVGKDAEPEAVQFLEFITNVDNARIVGATGTTLPVTKGAEDSVTDPFQLAVLEGLSQATFVQLYLDQYFSPELGAAVNDAVATLFAGTATPEEVTQAITAAAG
jgi:raffinose/stachyose/melibiose transport system substrate-binding protein